MVNRRDVLKMGAGAALAASILPRVGASATKATQDGVRGFYLTGMTGSQQVPTVRTAASGGAMFTLDESGQNLRFSLAVHDIENVTQAHIHQGAMDEEGPIVVWLYPSVFAESGELIEGRADRVISQGTITNQALIGPLRGQPLTDLLRMIENGNAYVNVHTQEFPEGEIRGQLITALDFAESVGAVVGDGGGTRTTDEFGTTDTTDTTDTTFTNDGFGTTDTTFTNDGFGTTDTTFTNDGFGTTDTTFTNDGFGTTDTTFTNDGFGTTDTTRTTDCLTRTTDTTFTNDGFGTTDTTFTNDGFGTTTDCFGTTRTTDTTGTRTTYTTRQ